MGDAREFLKQAGKAVRGIREGRDLAEKARHHAKKGDGLLDSARSNLPTLEDLDKLATFLVEVKQLVSPAENAGSQTAPDSAAPPPDLSQQLADLSRRLQGIAVKIEPVQELVGRLKGRLPQALQDLEVVSARLEKARSKAHDSRNELDGAADAFEEAGLLGLASIGRLVEGD